MTVTSPEYSFAVIADTHIILESDENSSPYAVNGLATKRTRWAVEELKTLKPHFVIHVGDMVRPFPSLKSYEATCKLAIEIFSELQCPIYYLPGNHDIGDKPIASAPAPTMSKIFLQLYEKQFGKSYFSFDEYGCHFILLNSSLINSGMQDERWQWDWLKNELLKNVGRRKFVFMHYPPFLAEYDELSNYDNIDEPGRSTLFQLLAGNNIEALFAGHVHHFFYNQLHEIDLFSLPSTSFTRHDFSEIFNVEPEAEFGRDDVNKLGFAIVDVFPESHIVRLIESGGKLLTSKSVNHANPKQIPIHPQEKLKVPIGVLLRHGWDEIRALPLNNGLGEFTRKRVRNDYSLLATWQIGFANLQVPIDDMRNDTTLQRIQALKGMGQRITVLLFGIPDQLTLDLLVANRNLVGALEMIVPAHTRKFPVLELEQLSEKIQAPIYLAVLSTSADGVGSNTKYFSHSTNYGIHVSEIDQLQEMCLASQIPMNSVDGFSFRLSLKDDIWSQITAIEKYSLESGKSACVHLLNAKDSTAQAQFDDELIANRAALACIGAYSLSNGLLILDDLMDVDRAHFPRHGLIDRRGNLRKTARYIQTLLPVLSRDNNGEKTSLFEICHHAGWFRADFTQADKSYRLLLSSKSNSGLNSNGVFENQPNLNKCTDLSSGEIVTFEKKSLANASGMLLHLS